MGNKGFVELVAQRRSVRKYASKSIPREILTRCLEAARLAPSACNSQPWHFIVVDDLELKKKVSEAAFGGMYSINSFAKNAPVLVLVLRDKVGWLARMGGQFRGVQYSLVDIGIAIEHFVLQATEDGVGTCWLGWFDERAVKNVLNLPRDKKIDMMLSVGYPLEAEAPSKTRKTLEQMSQFNMDQKR